MATIDDIRAMFSDQSTGSIMPQQSPADYMAIYEKLKAANQQINQPQQPQPTAPQLNGWYQDNPEQAPTRQMNPLEQTLMGISDFGEGLMNATGFDASKGFTPENIGRFILGLPGQMVGAPLTGFSQLYEGLSGQNIIDRPDEAGMTYDYELDPTQRLAQLGNFVVNDIGMGYGGSARMLGNIGKAAGIGGNVAERLATGTIGKAMSQAKTWERNVAGVAGDIAEEAGEEFGQSFLDDTRWNQLNEGSLGRAAEGAAWGALGGGVMGAGGRALGHVLGKAQNPGDNTPDPASPASNANSGNPYEPYVQSANKEGHLPGGISDAAIRGFGEYETGKRVSGRSGSVNNRMTLAMAGIGRDRIIFGTDPVKAVWNRSDDDKADIFAWFNPGYAASSGKAPLVTMEQLTETFQKSDPGEIANDLNAYLKLAYPNGAARVAMARNPQTKIGGFFMDIAGFMGGNFFGVDQLTATTFGGDIDGDTAGLYFSTRDLNIHKYASELAYDSEGGSNADYAYSPFREGRFSDKDWGIRVDEVFKTLFTKIGHEYFDETNTTRHKLRAEFLDALQDHSDDRNAKIAAALTHLRGTLDEIFSKMKDSKTYPIAYSQRRKDQFNKLPTSQSSRIILNDVLDDVFVGETRFEEVDEIANAFVKKAEETLTNAAADSGLSQGDIDAAFKATKLSNIAYSAGSKGDMSHLLEAYKHLGLLTWHPVGMTKGHPTFRQYGELGYTQVKSVSTFIEGISALSQVRGFDDVFRQMNMLAFKVGSDGETPRTAIEGLVDNHIVEEAWIKSGLQKDAGTVDIKGLENFVETIRQEWNDYVDIFNNAIKSIGVLDWVYPVDKTPRRKFEKGEDDLMFGKALAKMLDSVEMVKIFPSWAKSGFEEGETLGTVLERYAKNRDFNSQIFINGGYEQKLFNLLLNSKKMEPRAVSSRLIKTLSSLSAAKVLYNGVFKDGVISTEEEFIVAKDLMGVINEFTGWKTTEMFKLFDPRAWSETEIGRLFFTENEYQQASILGGLNFMSKFADILEWYSHPDARKSGVSVDDITQKIDELGRIDAVHYRICQEIKEHNGKSPTLEFLVDVHMPWDSKMRMFQEYFGDDITLDFIDSSLKRPGSEDMVSSASQTLVAVESAATRLIKDLRLDDRKDLDDLIKILGEESSRASSSRISSFVSSLNQVGRMKIDKTILALQTVDALDVFNPDMEKATIELSYQGMYSFLEDTINGGPSSYLSDITEAFSGLSSIENFAGNRHYIWMLLTNGNFELTIQDPVSQSEVTLTRAKIFKDLCDKDVRPDAVVTDAQWVALFQEAPQLMGILVSDHVRTTSTSAGVSSSIAKTSRFTNALDDYERVMQSDERARGAGGGMRAALEFNINAVGNMLLDRTGYLPYLIRVVAERVGEDGFKRLVNKPRLLAKELYDVHDEVSKIVHARLAYNHGSAVMEEDRRVDNDASYRKLSADVTSTLSQLVSSYTLSRDVEVGAVAHNVAHTFENELAEQVFVDESIRKLKETLESKNIKLSKKQKGKIRKAVKNGLPAAESKKQLMDSLSGLGKSISDEFVELFDTVEAIKLILIVETRTTDGIFGTGVGRGFTNEDKAKIRDKVSTGFDGDVKQAIQNAFSDSDDFEARVYASLSEGMSKIFDKMGSIAERNPHIRLIGDLFTTFKDGNNAPVPASTVEGFIRRIGEITGDKAIADVSSDSEIVKNILASYKSETDAKEYSYKNTAFMLRSVVLEDLIKNVNQMMSGSLSGRLTSSLFENEEMFKDIFKEFPEAIAGITNPNGGTGLNYDNIVFNNALYNDLLPDRALPTANFTSEYVENICSKIRNSQSAGGNPAKVSMNGGETKHLMGFGFLDRDESRTFMGTKIKISDMESQYGKYDWYDRCHIKMPTGEIRVIQDARKALMDLGPDAEVEFYNPMINPHGIYQGQSPSSFNPLLRGHQHRLANIILRIVQDSQEAMVIKIKKKFADKAVIVDRKIRSDMRTRTNDSMYRGALLQQYNAFLDNFSDELVGLPEWTKDFGYTSEQALILAQGLATGFRTTILDANGNEVGYAHIDVTVLYNDAAFEERVNTILAEAAAKYGEGCSLGEARLSTVSPRTISARVSQAVSSYLREHPSENPYEEAFKAANNYDDFGYEKLSVRKVFSKIPSVGWNIDDSLARAFSPTPFLKLLQRLHGTENVILDGNQNVSPEVKVIHEEGSYTDSEENKIRSQIRVLNNYVEVLGGNNKPRVLSVFGCSINAARSLGIYDEASTIRMFDDLDGIRSVADPDLKHFYRYENNDGFDNYVICLDANKLDEAVLFADRAGATVLAPSSIVQGSFRSFGTGRDIKFSTAQKAGSRKLDSTYTAGISDLVSIHPSEYHAIMNRAAGAMSRHESRQVSEIISCMSADLNEYSFISMLGDASGVVRQSKYEQLKGAVSRNYKEDISTLFHDKQGVFSFVGNVTSEEIDGIVDSIDERSLKNRFKNKPVDVNELKNRVRIYLEGLSENSEHNLNLLESASPGDCIGVAVKTLGDSVEYAPIFLPDTAPKNTENITMLLHGTEVHVFYDGVFYGADPEQWGYIKSAPPRESMKMIVVPIPDELMPDGVDMIWNNETEHGRTLGKEPGIVLSTLWHYIKSEDSTFHLLCDWDADRNKFKPKDWVLDLIKSGTIDWAATIHDDSQRASANSRNLWSLLLTGSVKVPTLDNAQLKEIRTVIRNCRDHGINPFSMFGREMYWNPEGMKNPDTMEAEPTSNYDNIMFDMGFGQVNHRQMRLLLNAIDSNICPKDLNDSEDGKIFDYSWKMAVGSNGNRETIRIVNPYILNQTSQVEGEPGSARWSRQAFYTQGIEHGYMSREYQDAVRYSDFILRNPEFLNIRKRYIDDDARMASLDPVFQQSFKFDADDQFFGTYMEMKTKREIKETLNDTISRAREISFRGEDQKELQSVRATERMSAAVSRLEKAAGNINLPEPLIKVLACLQYGWTYGTGEYDFLYESTFVKLCDQMAYNWETYGTPVMNPETIAASDRIAMPLLPPAYANWIWENSSATRSTFGSFVKFRERMQEGMDAAAGFIGNIKDDPARQRVLKMLGTGLSNQWGIRATDTFGYIAGGMWIDDVLKTDTLIGAIVHADPNWDDQAYNELKKMADDQRKDIVNRLNQRGRICEVEATTSYGGKVTVYASQDLKSIQSVLNGMTEVSKTLALWNPGVLLSNMADRTVGTKMLQIALAAGRRGYGPYKTAINIDESVIQRAINDPVLQKIYVGLRLAAISGNELEALANMTDINAIDAYLNQTIGNSPIAKAAAKTYELASGGNWMLRTQIENFIYRFAMFADETPGLEFWQTDAPGQKVNDRNMTILESQLATDPAKWFVDILGGRSAASASMTAALSALNSAKKGDMAQRHVLGELIGEFCRKTTLGKFLFTTCISRFPNYALNVTHRVLNYVLPMSSIYYVFTSAAADIDNAIVNRNRATGQGRQYSLNLESTQIHTSLKEAFMVDCAKLGTTAVMSILVGVSGLLQPPDDEDKWGNPDEWLIAGYRIGESWWLQDILGIAMPCAVFMKSAMLGKMNTNILFNGIANCCYSNPVIKVSDAIGFVLDPEGSFFSDYELAKERYADAPGGAPGLMDYLGSNAASFGLSWTTQFFTPSFAREFYNNMQEYEHSYNRVYSTSAAGKLNEKGVYGTTKKTSYADAMIRRATRKNPVLGWVLDMVLQPEGTGYMASEMPFTIYYDDAMLANAEAISVKDLNETEKYQRCMEIYNYMRSFKSVDDLKETGFFLDYETRYALSEFIWDTYHQIDEEWQNLGAQGLLSYTVLGEGNFDLGKQRFYEMQEAKENLKQDVNDFYYKWIKNSYLSDSMVVYRRYNTTYARDDNGEIYATGMRPQGVLPFLTAPGTATEPEGTAGYENDFMSVSAVTGQPMSQRALVPVEVPVEWYDLSYFSENHDGSGYSSTFKDKYSKPTTSGTATSSTPSSGGSGYGGSGGGGGGRSGGGGSSPNIYYHPQSVQSPNATVGRRTTREKADLDYLRPNFETKGSREAYKRSDI